ncbi:phosphoglycerate dehydrogenase [Tepidibacillus decaturensis]|uniref:D-3-phosphoglycerate dehydrogenase n=1 Tax=Tepidibacillus decaturensis TaxID=1413211 RepID=A0A135L169_9BACI|nr:phosphoglycerate dehydrogenase [Tepidibacillus decaturensis]KXG42740.1 D-3-phosphoglycerate dehydrogenase [Tepidibacillus decaturensis]
MHKILVSDPISEVGLTKLREAADIQIDVKTDLSQTELLEIIGDYQGLFVRSQTKVTAEVLAAAKQLKVIGRAGVGVDNIDVKAATERGIVVINAPDGNTISAAEHSFAMLIAMARWIPQAHQDLKQGEWNRKKYVGVELNRKVLGIVGMGRIGSEVAKRAKAFNMNVICYDPYLTSERAEQLGIALGTLEEVIKQADFITVHTPLTKETKYLIDTPQFFMMKKGVRIINCARGGIIREEALLDALDKGIVAGAALDVYEQEPPMESPLRQHPKVVTTPHLGASTEEAQLNVAIDVAEEVYHFLKNEPFRNAVNMPSLPLDMLNHVRPYLQLAERMGRLVANVILGAIEKIEITYSGDIIDKEIDIITRTVLKGILSVHLGSVGEVNDVNAPILAKSRGIAVVESRSNKSHGFTNLVTVNVKTNHEEKHLAGTVLNGYGARIVNYNGFTVDLSPEGNILVMEHIDQPGIIGRIGTALGNARVNIATMQVGRNQVGGKAIAFLGIDHPVENELIDKIKFVQGVQNLFQVDL